MDVQIVAIAVGLVVSLLFSERFGLSAGGMIVPGYFALSLNQPGSILLTLFAAFVTYGIVRLVSNVALVYGRRRIALMLIVGFLVGSALRTLVAWSLGHTLVGSVDGGQAWLSVVGFIIPGLIALWLDRQGLIETLTPILTLSAAVRLVLILIGMEAML